MNFDINIILKYIEPGNRGSAISSYQAIYSIGIFLGPLISGIINETAGRVLFYEIFSIIGASAAFLYLVVLKKAIKKMRPV